MIGTQLFTVTNLSYEVTNGGCFLSQIAYVLCTLY